ncbi:hypothetical protein CRM22_001202 [Opisthorchis felineus]|nr:hypothetical protein CRM22_001202 [Opisthorchis felineus]
MSILPALPQMICFGDSLTQRGWSYDGGWLAILADNFVRRIDIIGRGYSGYNTRMCRQILPDLYPDRASVALCRMFIIFLGANDASKAEQHVPVDEYKENLKTMVSYLNGLGIPKDHIMLISLPPVDEARWGSRHIAEGTPLDRELKNCPVYAAACEEVAVNQGLPCVNLFKAMIAQNDWIQFFNDGLHFSRRGSEFLAQILISILNDVLSDCPVRLPDWRIVNKANPTMSFQQYKDEWLKT